MIDKVKVGADPELFLTKNGKPFSAEGIIGGSKDEPKLTEIEGCCLQEDNVMAEFNITPSENEEDFNENIDFMLDTISTIALVNDCEIMIKPSAIFEKDQLITSQAMEFGCSPDFNAYNFMENERVEIKENLRAAGGHIHIGYENPTKNISLQIVRALDIFLGLPSLFLDDDTRRRQYYGNAGAYREKTYGVEYRTLSNFWIQTEELRLWAFRQVMLAIDFVSSGEILKVTDKQWGDIELAINDNDKSLASAIEQQLIKTKKEN
jgi:hypothetical protein